MGSSRLLRPDSSSNAMLRLRLDTADGLCDLALSLQDDAGQASVRLALAPGQVVAGSDVLERLVSQLTQSVVKERGGVLELATTPPGATVRLAGLDAGVTPLRLEGLAPGAMALSLSLPEWSEVAETLQVQAGQNLTIQRKLERSSEWLESKRSAGIAGHRDSVWNAARAKPAKDLGELFDRLAFPVAAGSRAPVAILPFDVQGAQDGSYNPGIMAAEYGVARWSADTRFVVLERQGVSKLLAEQAFAQSGATSDSGAARMGKLAAAKYLVTGTVSVADGKQVFAARLVSVETGEIVSAAVAEKPSMDMEALYREALGEKGQLSASVYRSLVGPGWGQFYTGHPVHGCISLGAVAASIAFATVTYLDYADKDDVLQKFRKHDPSTAIPDEEFDAWQARAEVARSDKNDAGTMLGISLGVVGVAWVANVVDAAILGHLESGRIQAKYFAYVPTPLVRPEGLALAWRF